MMAAGLNISNFLQELGNPPCNANHLGCKNEDNNNNINNAEEPCLPPCTVSQEQECTCEHRREGRFKTQGKEDETEDPHGDPCNSPVSPKNSNNKNRTDQATPRPNISAKGSVFEKWAAMDRANERPLAKRQLSDFSKSLTSRTVKKTLVKEEARAREKVQRSATQQDRRNDQIVLNQHGSRRKLQKELISNTEDFYKVDTQAISAGQEVGNI